MTVAIHARSNTGTGSVQSHTLASFTPPANSTLYFVEVAMRGNHTESFSWADPGGTGLTWTPRATSSFYLFEAAAEYAIQCRVSSAPIGGSPVSQSLTSGPGSASGAEFIAALAFTQTDDEVNTGSPFPQAFVAGGGAVNPTSDTAGGTLTLGSAPASANKCFAIFGVGCNQPGGPSTPAGWTLEGTLFATEYVTVNLYSRTGSTDTDAAVSDLGQEVGNWCGVIWEVAAPAAAAETDQEGYRFRNDDGSETTATWREVQDAITYVDAEEVFRVRFLLDQANGPANITPRLEWKQGAGSWAAVPLYAAPVAPSVTWGAAGTSANGTTSCTPAYPTGISASTSKLYCVVTGRSNTASTVPTMPAGWTRIGGLEGGTGTWGVDTGTRRVDVFAKDTVTGSETGTETVSLSGSTANTMRATILRVEVPSGHSISAELATGADTSNDTSYSATSSASLDFLANDLLLTATAQNIDSGTASSRAVSSTNVTFGTLTNRADTAVTSGNDHRHIINTVPVSSVSGTPDNTVTYSYTISASGSGPTAFLRLRSVAPTPPEVVIAPSSNVTAGGEATTAQLTAPSGKTTSDVTAGRMWDDENGSDAITFGAADLYTEVEWPISTSAAASGTYDLRVTNAGTVLDAYLASASFTIGTPPPPSDFLPLHRKRHQVIHR